MRLLKAASLLIVTLMLVCSCSSSKRVAYLVDVPLNQPREFVEEYDLHIKKNDVLSIFVFSKEPSLAAPFNMELTQDQLFGNNTTNNNQSRTYEESRQGFIVDSDGYIDYPVFGKLKVEGLTREQISDMIKDLLITNGYINDPLVLTRLKNFKVSVLGDVGSPGIVQSTNDRLTILEAISQAGDLQISGKRKNVKLIRENDGKREVVELDLQDPNLLFSDYYYLRQNDVVYVTPGNSKAFQANVTTFWSFFVGAFGLAMSIYAIVK